jgi:hypothetical protein
MNIGNIQMPIEDFVKLVEDYESANEADMKNKRAKSSRILFLYGTRFSQREDTLIGKMCIDFTYSRELVETTSNRAPGVSVSNDLYLQKEVYINRKVPLNGYLTVNVENLSGLKSSLENIEYLMSLHNHPDTRDNMLDRSLLSAQHFDVNKRTHDIDRKRALLKIYKEGLNLGVITSVFEETPELKSRFGVNESKIVFRTLHPDFEFEYEHRIKMDTKIFEHLKYSYAVFEVRHYFVDDLSDMLDVGREVNVKAQSESNSEFNTDTRDFITLGYAKVPLANLISKSNGVDQDVVVLDQFHQKLGYLKLKMSLNYQSRKALTMYKEPAEKPVEGKYFLGLSFVELISQNNKYLHCMNYKEEIKHLMFKFKWNGVSHQVRYLPTENVTELPLKINVYFINKFYLLEIDFNEETFEKTATPIEIQLWTKVENKTRCMKDREELIGSVFVDLQSLITNRHNLRLRNEANESGIIKSHDGYYTILKHQADEIMSDRLGLSTFIIKKEFEGQKEQLEKMFYMLHTQTRGSILDNYDLNLKGTIEINDMRKIMTTFFENENERDFAYKYLDFCELKTPDVIFYSPFMNVLPPFFKYARRIDKRELIEFVHRRLSSVDNFENGFVENNMFKSVLE